MSKFATSQLYSQPSLHCLEIEIKQNQLIKRTIAKHTQLLLPGPSPLAQIHLPEVPIPDRQPSSDLDPEPPSTNKISRPPEPNRPKQSPPARHHQHQQRHLATSSPLTLTDRPSLQLYLLKSWKFTYQSSFCRQLAKLAGVFRRKFGPVSPAFGAHRSFQMRKKFPSKLHILSHPPSP